MISAISTLRLTYTVNCYHYSLCVYPEKLELQILQAESQDGTLFSEGHLAIVMWYAYWHETLCLQWQTLQSKTLSRLDWNVTMLACYMGNAATPTVTTYQTGVGLSDLCESWLTTLLASDTMCDASGLLPTPSHCSNLNNSFSSSRTVNFLSWTVKCYQK